MLTFIFTIMSLSLGNNSLGLALEYDGEDQQLEQQSKAQPSEQKSEQQESKQITIEEIRTMSKENSTELEIYQIRLNQLEVSKELARQGKSRADGLEEDLEEMEEDLLEERRRVRQRRNSAQEDLEEFLSGHGFHDSNGDNSSDPNDSDLMLMMEYMELQQEVTTYIQAEESIRSNLEMIREIKDRGELDDFRLDAEEQYKELSRELKLMEAAEERLQEQVIFGGELIYAELAQKALEKDLLKTSLELTDYHSELQEVLIDHGVSLPRDVRELKTQRDSQKTQIKQLERDISTLEDSLRRYTGIEGENEELAEKETAKSLVNLIKLDPFPEHELKDLQAYTHEIDLDDKKAKLDENALEVELTDMELDLLQDIRDWTYDERGFYADEVDLRDYEILETELEREQLVERLEENLETRYNDLLSNFEEREKLLKHYEDKERELSEKQVLVEHGAAKNSELNILEQNLNIMDEELRQMDWYLYLNSRQLQLAVQGILLD